MLKNIKSNTKIPSNKKFCHHSFLILCKNNIKIVCLPLPK